MYQHFSAQPPSPSTFNPHLPAAIDQVILRALSKRPDDRFPTISAFASAFEQAVPLSSMGPVVGPLQSSASDIRATLAISQGEAQSGTSRKITLPGGQQVNVMIPAGVSDGHIIRIPDHGTSPDQAVPVLLTITIKRPGEIQQPSEMSGAQEPLSTSYPKVQQPFDPSSDHDFPTLLSSDPHLQPPVRPSLPPVPEREPARRSRMVGMISGLIILVILLILAGVGYYFYNNHQATDNANILSQTATATSKLQTLTHAPTVTNSSTATQQNGLYIAGTYNGSMFDQTAQQTITISVHLVQSQGNAALSGTFTSGSSSQVAYPLTGTVDTQGNFSFTVQQANGQLPLFFHGQVYQSDYLKGNYCSSNTNSCSTDTGYFTVGPKF